MVCDCGIPWAFLFFFFFFFFFLNISFPFDLILFSRQFENMTTLNIMTIRNTFILYFGIVLNLAALDYIVILQKHKCFLDFVTVALTDTREFVTHGHSPGKPFSLMKDLF